MKATIHNSELEFISRCALDYENIETGGDLFGYWDKNGNPVVQFTTGAGKNTKRTNGSFFQDIDYLHECVQYLYKNHALEHIGSWHSHHEMSLSYPSGGDSATVMNSLNSFSTGKFLLVICNILSIRNKEVSVNGFVFSKTQENYKEIKWVTLLAKENPYRKEIVEEKNVEEYLEEKVVGLCKNKPIVFLRDILGNTSAKIPCQKKLEIIEKLKNKGSIICNSTELCENTIIALPAELESP